MKFDAEAAATALATTLESVSYDARAAAARRAGDALPPAQAL